jgi:hypothetical protein
VIKSSTVKQGHHGGLLVGPKVVTRVHVRGRQKGWAIQRKRFGNRSRGQRGEKMLHW